MQHKRATLAPKTAHAYASAVEHHLAPALGAVKAAKLTTYQVDKFYRSCPSQEIARKCHVILNGAYKQGRRWALVGSNPITDATTPRPTFADAAVPTPEEVAKLVNTAARIAGEDFAMLVHLTAVTGARTGEVAGWQFGDVDVVTGTIRVARSIDRLTNEVKAPKTKRSVRSIALDDATLDRLRSYMISARARALEVGTKLDDTAWLFSPRPCHTEHFRCDGIGHRFEVVRDAAGVDVGFHGLRHFCGTYLVADGTDLRTVMERLGHSQVSTTMRYAHGTTEADRRAAISIGGLVSGA